ncbi:MAG: SMP-30/gluconolactonase/LRE family protein, partial [Candidatus Binatia bacterium]
MGAAAPVETLAYGYGLIEGPRVDDRGNLFFSDVTNGGVFRLAPDGTISTVIPKRRGVGGIALHADGGLVVSGRDVCHVKDGVTRVLFERPEGVLGFNDLFTDAAGRVYVGSLRSDPFREGPRTPGECYRIEAEGRATELYGGVGLSNGIGFGPEGHVLYHADTAAREVIVHNLDDDGRAVHRRSFTTLGDPDGLAVDERGFVWVALYGGGRVVCHSPFGLFDDAIEVPARAVTSVCFGRDREL